MLSLHTESESKEAELDVKSQLGSGELQTQVPTDKPASLVLWQQGFSLVVWGQMLT